MVETWEQTKARLKKGIGSLVVLGSFEELVVMPSVPKVRYEEPILPKVKRFNIHKRSLPPGLDQVVAMNLSKREAEYLTEYISDRNKIPLLRTKVYEDDTRETKTLIYFDIIPVDATPRERSIYSNPARFCTEEFPNSKTPKRIN